MPLNTTRLRRLETVFAPPEEDPGMVAFVSSNMWPGEERLAYEAARGPVVPGHPMNTGFCAMHATTPEQLAIVEARCGVRVRMILDVPAPPELADLPEAERERWCAENETRPVPAWQRRRDAQPDRGTGGVAGEAEPG